MNNLNKPTTSLGGKIAITCATAATFIQQYAYWAHNDLVMWAAGGLGLAGVVLPIWFTDATKSMKP